MTGRGLASLGGRLDELSEGFGVQSHTLLLHLLWWQVSLFLGVGRFRASGLYLGLLGALGNLGGLGFRV